VSVLKLTFRRKFIVVDVTRNELLSVEGLPVVDQVLFGRWIGEGRSGGGMWHV
jgi:hypothetical protein